MVCQGFSFIFESFILLLFILFYLDFFSLFILITLCICIIASKLVFQWIFECVNELVSTSTPIYCAFPRTHFLLFAFPILMLVLLFYYYPLDPYLLIRDRKGVNPHGKGGGKELRAVEGEKAVISIHYMRKIYL